MTYRWRARIVYAALFIPTMVGYIGLREGGQPTLYGSLIAVCVVLMFAMPSLLLRCPHCGGRQVGFDLWGYFAVGDRCRKCQQRLVGPKLREVDLALEMLGEEDPAEAKRLGKLVAAQDRLRAGAITSREAASAWRHELLRQQVDALAFIRDLEARRAAPGPGDAAMLAEAKDTLGRIRRELTEVTNRLDGAT